MTEMERIHSGELYVSMDQAILEVQLACLDLQWEYNQTRPSQQAERTALLQRMLAECGEGVYIEAPFYANWGGRHCHLGRMVYANYGLTCVDDTHIYIGDYTKLGPRVTIATAGHPILPELRERGYQYNAPVRIGSRCWIGAGALIMPGITIGDGSVIGAGSVVTRDIPPNVVAVGNPCRVVRQMGERDRTFYWRDRRIPEELREDL